MKIKYILKALFKNLLILLATILIIITILIAVIKTNKLDIVGEKFLEGIVYVVGE